ncbi:hypothetical protein BGZ58_005383 [Dissophora ornata]|nr:hypothetical protein BGZ58_005383 [Dissophora ornata]
MDHPSFSQAREFRNSQYDEYYGVAPPQPLYALEGSGSSKRPFKSEHKPSVKSFASPLFRAKTLGNASGGTYQQQQNQHPYYGPASLSASQILHGDSGIPIAMSGIEDSSGSEPSESVSESPLAVQGEQGMIRPKSMSLPHGPAPSHADLRPQSMMILGNALPPPSNLIIPPSITTRPRSMLNPSAIYASQAQSQSQGQYQQQHPHPYYQQQQQQRYYPAPQDYYYQQYPVSPALYPSAHGTPTMTHEVAVAEDDSEYAAAAGVGSSSGSGSGSGIGSASNDGTESEQLMSKEVGKRPSESSLSTPSSPSHTVPESNDASASDGSA